MNKIKSKSALFTLINASAPEVLRKTMTLSLLLLIHSRTEI